MAKKIDKLIKIQVPAGQAKPSPPIGPVLGQAGVNIMMFVKEFNATTASMEAGTILPVVITVYSDRSFTFILKTPPAAVLLKKVAKIASGSAEPNKKKVGKITREQLRAVAETKMPDLNCYDVDAASRIIEGTARSMGLEIEG